MDKRQAPDRVRAEAQVISGFDYSVPAELFSSRSKKSRGRTGYRRFDTAAEAVRFAVEELAPPALLGAYLEVDKARFGYKEIQSLYESATYPLRRPAMTN
jgi:hypothetical protein